MTICEERKPNALKFLTDQSLQTTKSILLKPIPTNFFLVLNTAYLLLYRQLHKRTNHHHLPAKSSVFIAGLHIANGMGHGFF